VQWPAAAEDCATLGRVDRTGRHACALGQAALVTCQSQGRAGRLDSQYDRHRAIQVAATYARLGPNASRPPLSVEAEGAPFRTLKLFLARFDIVLARTPPDLVRKQAAGKLT